MVAIFQRSPEYAEDPRLPPSLDWTRDQVRLVPRGVVMGVKQRATYQATRAWLEGMRTAPRGASMTSVSLADPRRIAYATAKKLIPTLDAAAMRRLGMDPALLARLKKAGWTGLGEAPDPAFDFNVEPPELAVLLETAKLVARTSSRRTGQVIELSPDVQQEYVDAKQALDAEARPRGSGAPRR